MSPSEQNESASTKKESSGVWLQGVTLGLLISVAFAIGWVLAKNGDGDSPRSDTEAPSRPMQQPTVFAPVTPVPAAPPPAVAEPVAPQPQPQPIVPVPVPVPAQAVIPAETAPEVPAGSVVSTEKDPSGDEPESMRTWVKREPAKLAITAEPGTNVLLINGRDMRALGTTDGSGRLLIDENLPPGGETISLVFRHPKCVSERRNGVELRAGETTNVVMALRYLPGTLAVIAEPAEAEVRLDGVSVGKGFVMIGDVSANMPHVVEVSVPGRDMVRRTVTVEPDLTRIERISILPLKEETGDVLLMGATRVLAGQPGAVVKIDDKPVTVDQGLIRGVAVGNRAVSIFKGSTSDGAAAKVVWERVVRVEPGLATSLLDDTKPNPEPVAGAPEALPAEPTVKEAYLALTFLDAKQRVITADPPKVSFNGTELVAGKDGTWAIPPGVSGVFRAEIAGYEPYERPLQVPNAGKFVIMCYLTAGAAGGAKPAERALTVEPWKSKVLSLSEDDGVMAISITPEIVVRSGQDINFTPEKTLGSIVLRIVDVGANLVTCQILPRTSKSPMPAPGEEGTVTTESPAR